VTTREYQVFISGFQVVDFNSGYSEFFPVFWHIYFVMPKSARNGTVIMKIRNVNVGEMVTNVPPTVKALN